MAQHSLVHSVIGSAGLALVIQLACAMAGPSRGEGCVVDVPANVKSASLYASQPGFGIVTASDMETASDVWRLYTCRLTLSRIVTDKDPPALVPAARFSSLQGAKVWPECAASEKAGLFRVAFQEVRDSGVQALVGTMRLPNKAEGSLDVKTTAVRSSDVSGLCSLSFVENWGTEKWQGIVGVDSYGRLWVSTTSDRQLASGAKWSVSPRISEGFHPRAAFIGDEALLVFCLSRESSGDVRAVRCEHGNGRWAKRAEDVVYRGAVSRIAIGMGAEGWFLLIGEARQTRHHLRLLLSKDKGNTWREAAEAELGVEGRMTELALADDRSRAAAILENAEGKSKVFVASLRRE